MTTIGNDMDYSDLKRLAEAAIPGPWVVKEDSMGGEDEVYCSWHKVGPLSFIGEKLSKDTAYVAAASPDVVLRLLAEVERLQSNIDERTGGVVRLMTERDTLRAQNTALLEALQEMVYWFPCDQPDSVKHIGDRARAAIAAAEGKDV